MTCEQVRIFTVSFLLWHGPSIFAVSIKGSPNYVTVHDKQGGLRTDSSPAPWKYFFYISRRQSKTNLSRYSIFWTVSSTCTRYERVGRLKICASESECRTMLKCSQSVTLYTFMQISPILKNGIMDIKIAPPSSKKNFPNTSCSNKLSKVRNYACSALTERRL